MIEHGSVEIADDTVVQTRSLTSQEDLLLHDRRMTVAMVDNAGNYLENQQLEPDVRQPLDPGIVSQGRDQQLEAAVKVLLGN